MHFVGRRQTFILRELTVDDHALHDPGDESAVQALGVASITHETAGLYFKRRWR